MSGGREPRHPGERPAATTRKRVRTARLEGNQERIDELEYFLEGIGRWLFGPDGEDFRSLGRFVPRTRNLSALLELGRRARSSDPADDLAFVYGEVESWSARQGPSGTPRAGGGATVLRYTRYAELLAHPERLLDRVPPAQRLEVVERMTRGSSELGPLLARMNAYAWLRAVGLPDLRAELTAPGPPRIELGDPRDAQAEVALDLIFERAPGRAGAGLRRFFRLVHDELHDDYRSQLARLGGKTEPA